ncbi:hypothetical protein LCGC14_0727430 [marine sediment metagenome]|uniref:Uncharacterized protein n=1 Tax=marine sediment metagenome TaxID=412755 RepID=A0A0F9THR5_9ZZZZ
MNINHQKILSILTVFIIIILLIGFVFMSLILRNTLIYTNLYFENFIDFIRDLIQSFF